MGKQTPAASEPVRRLRLAALRYPEVQEGTVCNKSAFKARNKAFLFIGMDDRSYNVMVKLHKSLAEAATLEAKEPECYKVGGRGWVKITFCHAQSPPPGLLERWIDESYRLLVPKQLAALLQERSLPALIPTRTATKTTRKKKSPSR